MYQIFMKMLYRTASTIIKSYVITFGDEEEFDNIGDNEYTVADVLDMAYCLAKEFEKEHIREIKTYHVSK